MRCPLWFAAGAAALVPTGAQGETLPVAGVYAAGTDAPSRARSIAIADFSGRGGERLAFAIDSALRGAVIDGRPWFDLTFTAPAFGDSYTYDAGADPRGVQRGGADAVMRGIAEVEWRDVDSGTKEVEECVTRNSVGTCTEKKKVSYTCRARNVTLRPEVRMVARGGELLYAKGDTRTASRSFCKDEQGTPSVDSIVEELVGGFAAVVRGDLAPIFRDEEIRVLESRDGMSKSDQATFRTALRFTKTDVSEACAIFGELKQANPQSVTLLFNTGLCMESVGELDTAARLYEEALAVSPRKLEPQQGLDRIASRLRAERQFSLREAAAAN
jgi:hypothetical protein